MRIKHNFEYMQTVPKEWDYYKIERVHCGFCTNCGTEIYFTHYDMAHEAKKQFYPYIIYLSYVLCEEAKSIHERYPDIPIKEIQKNIDSMKPLALELKKASEECKLTTCPICQFPLERPVTYDMNSLTFGFLKKHDSAYQAFNDFKPWKYAGNFPKDTECVERYFDFLHYCLEQPEKEAAKKRLDAIMDAYALDESLPSSSETNIRTDVDKLKQYIFNLLTVETNIYSVSTRLMELYTMHPSYERSVRRCNAMRTNNLRNEVKPLESRYNESLSVLDNIRLVNVEKILLPKPQEPHKPSAPTLGKPGLFNRKAVLANNAYLTARYEKALQDYETQYTAYRADLEQCKAKEQQLNAEAHEKHVQAVAAAKNEVAKRKTELEQAELAVEDKIKKISTLPSAESFEKQVLDEEIVQAEALLKNLLNCRNNLYAYNIVFDKYHSLVALSSFYEYLASGRCDTLEGPTGAYNIFETECRANQIISQLSVVIDSLEQIKEGQSLLYKQLSRVNKNLKTISSSMDSMIDSLKGIEANTQNISLSMDTIAANTEVIAHNTAKTAYYSKINAELTNSLGYLVALH